MVGHNSGSGRGCIPLPNSGWRRPDFNDPPHSRQSQKNARRGGRAPVFEAMLEVESECPLDDVLARFTRIPPSIYHALGADELAIDHLDVIDGGRS
jgi:hypothetical protein